MPTTDARSKIASITRSLNAAAKRKGGEDAAEVAFIAKGNEDRLRVGRIPTGIHNVDELIGGGWQRGGFSMLWGSPGAGKTCLVMETIAHNQRLAKAQGREFWTIYWHNEAGAFPYESALMAGVDLDTLVILDTQRSGEQVLNTLTKYLWDPEKNRPLNAVDLVVIDSVASVEPEAEVNSIEEKGLEGSTVGRHAALFSKYFRHIAGGGKLGRYTCFLLINQVRMKVDSYGGGETATGGQAMEFYPKIAIKVSAPASKRIKMGTGKTEKVVGHTVVCRITKNNTGGGSPFAETEYVVRYGEGVDTAPILIEHAKKMGVIVQTSPGWFHLIYSGALPGGELSAKVKVDPKAEIENSLKVQGSDNLEAWVRTDELFRGWLESQVVAAIAEQSAAQVADRPDVDVEEIAEADAVEPGEETP